MYSDSRVLRNEKFGDILHEYLFLELGKSKKEVYNLMSLTQSMKIYSKMRDTNRKFFNNYLSELLLDT